MKRRDKLTPTQIIEKSRKNKERMWYKEPLKTLVRASLAQGEHRKTVYPRRQPKPEEKIIIHTHNYPGKLEQYSESEINFLPGVHDLRFLAANPDKTLAIALRVEGKLAGYTFFRFEKGKNTEQARAQMAELVLGPCGNTEEKIEFLRELGLKLKFVPNRKQGFDFKELKFIRAEKNENR